MIHNTLLFCLWEIRNKPFLWCVWILSNERHRKTVRRQIVFCGGNKTFGRTSAFMASIPVCYLTHAIHIQRECSSRMCWTCEFSEPAKFLARRNLRQMGRRLEYKNSRFPKKKSGKKKNNSRFANKTWVFLRDWATTHPTPFLSVMDISEQMQYRKREVNALEIYSPQKEWSSLCQRSNQPRRNLRLWKLIAHEKPNIIGTNDSGNLWSTSNNTVMVCSLLFPCPVVCIKKGIWCHHFLRLSSHIPCYLFLSWIFKQVSVPQCRHGISEEQRPLSNWVHKQRAHMKRRQEGLENSLSQRKISLLKEIGFVW